MIAAVLALAFAAAWVGDAAAHAVLVAAAPADRSVIADAPNGIALRFNEAVTPVAVRLIDTRGHVVEARVAAQDETVRIVPAALLVPGAYIVSWRVISEDSHPVAGAFQFAVGNAPPSWAAPATASARAAIWSGLAIVDRAMYLAALTLAVGGALYGLLIGTAPRRLIVAGAWVAIATALLAIGLEGGLVLDRPLADLGGAELWRFGAQTSLGLASGVAILGLAAVLLRQPSVGAGLVVASFALSGHAATAPPRLATMSALLLHVSLALVWLGAFVPSIGAASDAHARLGRISKWAVPVLITAGLLLAVFQVRAIPPLVETTYGLALLAKIALVGALVALVVRSRRRGMDRKVFVMSSLTLAGAILAATAILTEVPPPRSLAGPAAFSVTAPVGAAEATVTVTPGTAGRNAIVVRFADAVAPREVAVQLSNAATGIEEITRPLARQSDGSWRHDGPELAIPGDWTLRFEALIDDFTRRSFTVQVPVR